MAISGGTFLAAIDIGSSAIRIDIAEVREDGSIHALDTLKKAVQLGKDAFTLGYLSEESIRAACAALRDFKKVMDSYGVAKYRAVATSAVRESSNSDTFLDRVLVSTGLDVDIIDGSEENRLTYAAVMDSVQEISGLEQGTILLVEVGGGSTDLTLLRSGEPLHSGTFPMGSIRLREDMSRAPGSYDQQMRLLKRQINNQLANIRRSIPIKEATHYIAVGGDVRAAARIISGSSPDGSVTIVSREKFAEFVDAVTRHGPDELVQKYALTYPDAEIMAPALFAYFVLLKDTQAQEAVISGASIRQGILQDLAPQEKGKGSKKLAKQILAAARSLGRRYQYDENHAQRVRELCDLIFEELRNEHGLDDSHRLYLQVAAILHDIGLFVNNRGHHKHSQYLIASSDLFGLRAHELGIIANVARYHRRSLPQRTHIAFMSLDRYERVVVSKLAAILRVANALDRGHLQKVTDMTIAREGDQLLVLAQNASDLTMERVALANRSDLFNEVFGKKIVLREAVAAP